MYFFSYSSNLILLKTVHVYKTSIRLGKDQGRGEIVRTPGSEEWTLWLPIKLKHQQPPKPMLPSQSAVTTATTPVFHATFI